MAPFSIPIPSGAAEGDVAAVLSLSEVGEAGKPKVRPVQAKDEEKSQEQ